MGINLVFQSFQILILKLQYFVRIEDFPDTMAPIKLNWQNSTNEEWNVKIVI